MTKLYFIKEVTTGNILKIAFYNSFFIPIDIQIDPNLYSTSPIWLTDNLILAKKAIEQLNNLDFYQKNNKEELEKYIFKIYSFVVEENEEI
jgi:hypothetical protein